MGYRTSSCSDHARQEEEEEEEEAGVGMLGKSPVIHQPPTRPARLLPDWSIYISSG
jgi:hypothetical protein